MNFKSSFNEVLNSEIAPILADMETIRKTHLSFARLLSGVWALIILALIGFPYFFGVNRLEINTDIITAIIFLLPFSPMVFALLYGVLDKKYTKKLKEKIANKLVCAFGNIKRVQPKEDILSMDFVKKSRLFPLADYRDDDDCFIGKRHGVPFFILETKFYYGGGMAPAMIFSGLLLCVKTKKNF